MWADRPRRHGLTATLGRWSSLMGQPNLEPERGFEPTNLPITNRLRCHCATRARKRRTLHSRTLTGGGAGCKRARQKYAPPRGGLLSVVYEGRFGHVKESGLSLGSRR